MSKYVATRRFFLSDGDGKDEEFTDTAGDDDADLALLGGVFDTDLRQ